MLFRLLAGHLTRADLRNVFQMTGPPQWAGELISAG
jgi:hypothetical protein